MTAGRTARSGTAALALLALAAAASTLLSRTRKRSPDAGRGVGRFMRPRADPPLRI
jgi:hypothetical protein